MDSPRPQLLILADAPDALVELHGVSLLERLLRIAQRLGFREAVILSKTSTEIASHLAKPSWARAEVALSFRDREPGPFFPHEVVSGNERTLVVSAISCRIRNPLVTNNLEVFFRTGTLHAK